MALTKGINSYAEVADFDAYFADRLNVDAATLATPEEKAQALVTASSILDDKPWVGTVIEIDQPMAFPRNGTYFDPRLGGRVYLASIIPNRILNATLELAYHLLLNPNVTDDTGSVKNLTVGPIHLDLVLNAPTIPSKVRSLITPLLVNRGSSPYWRAN